MSICMLSLDEITLESVELEDEPNYGMIIGITIVAVALVGAAVIGICFARRKLRYSNIGVRFQRQDSDNLSFAK